MENGKPKPVSRKDGEAPTTPVGTPRGDKGGKGKHGKGAPGEGKPKKEAKPKKDAAPANGATPKKEPKKKKGTPATVSGEDESDVATDEETTTDKERIICPIFAKKQPCFGPGVTEGCPGLQYHTSQ